MKRLRIVIAAASVAGLVVLGLWTRREEPASKVGAANSEGVAFELAVIKPLSARPLFGLLPDRIPGLPPNELRFDHESAGAKVVRADERRLELRADDWSFLLEADGDGKAAAGTYLHFSLELAEKQQTLRCRPAKEASGLLEITPRAGSNELDGQFHVKLATCENARTGKTINWPPRPLTVQGSFSGVVRGRR